MIKNILIMNYKIKTKDIIVFSFFCILTLAGALNHELWFDEAEAWVIARDNSTSELWTALKSEGHPFLWYLLLKLFALTGLSVDILPLISWAITSVTSAVIILKAPFGRTLKYLTIFSSGFLFFNCVISRVYCLILLLLVLIAVLYPEKENHPVYYGVLIALLANTHICICGVVAFLGIDMLIGMIKHWRDSTFSQKLRSILGVGAAGIGVIVLFVTLLGSLSENAEISDEPFNILEGLSGAFLTFYDVPVLASLPDEIPVLSELISIVFTCGVIVLLILLRRNIKGFSLFLSFIMMYMITCGLVWNTNANRAALVYFAFVFSCWIGVNSNSFSVGFELKVLEKTNNRLIKAIVDIICNLDSNPLKSTEKILCVLMALTVPAGIVYLFNDYYRDFAPEKSASEFIVSNYSADTTVIVSKTDALPQLTCYMPEYVFYSAYLGSEYTYHNHSISIDDMIKAYDENRMISDLLTYKDILYVEINSADDDAISLGVVSVPGKKIFSCIHTMKYSTKNTNLILSEVTLEELVEYLR